MTRILVQRGSGSSSSSSSSSSQNRTSSAPGSSTVSSQPLSNPPQVSNPIIKEEEVVEVVQEQDVSNEVSELGSCIENKISRIDDCSTLETDHGRKASDEMVDSENLASDCLVQNDLMRGFCGLTIREHEGVETSNTCNIESSKGDIDGSQPPDPPCPPPKPLAANSNSRRFTSGTSNPGWSGSSRPTRSAGWPIVSRTSPTGSRPSSPRAHSENEGYNSADEQSPCFGSSYNELERERQFEIDIRRAKGLEVKRMQGDGNCLFRAVADQVYGDSETYDLVRQMCIDYMERERDHFSQFVTEGFTSYCMRKRRDKVYGNNLEIQAMSEMYNRPIHIYSYSTEPINIFHRNYNTDLPPIRLSYHHGNHYNSLVDPRRLNVGAGLGFSSLRGRSVDKDQVKAAIKAQQDQQIENALVAEGRFYSDLELTEKEIERMVMEASRAEYLSSDKLNKQLGHRESSTSGAEPSSSGARPSSGSGNDKELSSTGNLSQATGLSSAMQVVLSMGFSYLQAIEAYSIFGDDVDSMVCYLLETNSTSSGGGSSSRRKGKATE